MEGIVLSFLLYNVIMWLIYSHYKRGEYKISNKNLIWFTVLFVALGTYGNHIGDYWRLNEVIELYGSTSTFDIGKSMEEQYYMLAKFVNGNYVLWRLVINAIAFIGLAFFLRKANMDNYPTLLLFAAMCLFWVAGHRGRWGYIYYYFGVFLFFKNKNPLYLLLAALSYFSHSSVVLLLALLPFSFFKFNRYLAIFAIIALVFGMGFFQDYFDSIALNGLDNEYYSHKVETYAGQTANNFFGSSIGEYLQNFFSMVPMYLFMFYMSKKMLFDRSFTENMGREYNAVANVSIILFFVSIMAYFMNLGSGTIAYRILTMSTFPIIILYPYVLTAEKERYVPKMTKWFFVSTELVYLFSTYYAFMHPDYFMN